MVRPAILVHGGAGDATADESAEPWEQGALQAARAGHVLLAAGKSALDAVQAAVELLEDNPLFNAGTGSALNEAGDVEMDAAVMEGHRLRAGGVAVVKCVRHPVRLARAVMEKTGHVLLASEGAMRFAFEQGLEMRAPAE